MWQSSNTIRAGQMLHIALCCLEGSTPEDGSGASHQAKDIVVAPGEPFCTANGSYFVFWGLRRSCWAGLGVAA